MSIKVVKQELETNEDCSNDIKEILKSKNVYLINVMGSPGTGKTSLIIELIKLLKDRYNIAVVEGDIAGQVDAEKIDSLGISVVQLNTEGACHIEAKSIKTILGYFDLDEIDIIFIENIGNLVCPAEFEIGEDLKIAILSIPEGDDKVEKYPLLFSKANAIALNKFDMMEHFDFDDNKVEEDIRLLNLSSEVFRISSRTGEGLNSLATYVEGKINVRIKNKLR
ncbi:hydrogenase nickel incorporation protein HypB [Clostridium sp. YIM B02505]|uniref:Hydrogenase nickel incorporation protein HypB n=1 Tax=Clostridium yunnanense TaxID=2800325 RepID=A0ABS1EP88_9CLOT|nr:hydrogenase nickel incorporation protein HypB [Clostridium yunnanense]MBK1811093.1 hydrogenase nickel incorporation protein HypB [Clostridium yunnanense]